MEEWKPIPGYEEFYEISDEVRVRRVSDRGNHPRYKAGGLLLPSYTKLGYVQYRLVNATRVRRVWYAHRLIWTAFVGPIPEGYVIHHRDHDGCNNRLENLEMMTQRENCNIKRKRTLFVGETHPAAKLTETDVLSIVDLYLCGEKTQSGLAAIYGVTQNHISDIVTGSSWSWLTGIGNGHRRYTRKVAVDFSNAETVANDILRYMDHNEAYKMARLVLGSLHDETLELLRSRTASRKSGGQ